MKLKDAAGWANACEKNRADPYGASILDYAERWANIMEGELTTGKKLEDIARETSLKAGEGEGITGFMYGIAVGVLSQVWEHGEELRRWNNLDLQLGDEGERANETGGVLNPAILCREDGTEEIGQNEDVDE